MLDCIHVKFMAMHVHLVVIWTWIENRETSIELLGGLTWLFVVIFGTVCEKGARVIYIVCTEAVYVHTERVYADFTILIY